MTGFRIVGAVWVMLLHFQPVLYEAWPKLSILEPLISQGFYGVPLFFILSGYIIQHNYGTKSILNPRSIAEFLWRRFARLWPVNILSQLMVIPVVFNTIFIHNYWGMPIPSWFSIGGWLKSVFMIQLIGEPKAIYPWNQPSWSLNGEMLAYVFFIIIIALILFLKIDEFKHRWIFIIGAFGIAYSANYLTDFDYSWILFLAAYFLSGLCLRLAGPTPKFLHPVLIGLQFICPVALVLCVYIGYMDLIGIILLAWVYSLTIDNGLMTKFFSSKPLKIAGYSSYSLYMLHYVIFGYGYILIEKFPIIKESYFQLYAICCLLLVCLCSYVVWKIFETPSRNGLNKLFKRVWPKK